MTKLRILYLRKLSPVTILLDWDKRLRFRRFITCLLFADWKKIWKKPGRSFSIAQNLQVTGSLSTVFREDCFTTSVLHSVKCHIYIEYKPNRHISFQNSTNQVFLLSLQLEWSLWWKIVQLPIFWVYDMQKGVSGKNPNVKCSFCILNSAGLRWVVKDTSTSSFSLRVAPALHVEISWKCPLRIQRGSCLIQAPRSREWNLLVQKFTDPGDRDVKLWTVVVVKRVVEKWNSKKKRWHLRRERRLSIVQKSQSVKWDPHVLELKLNAILRC